jgi:hypothetical protein
LFRVEPDFSPLTLTILGQISPSFAEAVESFNMSAEHAELLGSFMVLDMFTTTSLSVNNIQALYKVTNKPKSLMNSESNRMVIDAIRSEMPSSHMKSEEK